MSRVCASGGRQTDVEEHSPWSPFRRFPNPINETATRVTAGEVVALNAVALGLGQMWLLPLVAADYTARALAGPRFSPLALLAAKGIIPRLKVAPHWTAGPPKRFAAAIGATLMIGASSLYYLTNARKVAYGVGAVMLLFPALESFLGLCVGCKMFGVLMTRHLVPDDVCAECADISLRYR